MSNVLNVMAFACLVTSLFTRSVDPIIPRIASSLAIDTSTAALLSTAFAIPYALVQPILGAAADMFGKTRLMTWSLVILTLAGFTCAISTNFPMLLASRVVAGIASGGVFPVAVAITGDLVSVDRRQLAIGRLLAAAMTGNLLGASAAGLIGDLISWRGVFFACGLIGSIALLTALYSFRGAKSAIVGMARFDLSAIALNYREIFSNPLAKICFGSIFLAGSSIFGVFPYMATLLQTQGEVRSSIAGVVLAGFGIGALLYTFMIPILLERIGERRLMIGGGAVMALGLIVVALRMPWPAEFVNFLMLGFGFFMLNGCILVYVSELAPKARASAVSLHSASFFLGQGVGPVLYGAGFLYIGIVPSLAFGAAALIGIGFVCACFLRREPQEITLPC